MEFINSNNARQGTAGGRSSALNHEPLKPKAAPEAPKGDGH